MSYYDWDSDCRAMAQGTAAFTMDLFSALYEIKARRDERVRNFCQVHNATLNTINWFYGQVPAICRISQVAPWCQRLMHVAICDLDDYLYSGKSKPSRARRAYSAYDEFFSSGNDCLYHEDFAKIVHNILETERGDRYRSYADARRDGEKIYVKWKDQFDRIHRRQDGNLLFNAIVAIENTFDAQHEANNKITNDNCVLMNIIQIYLDAIGGHARSRELTDRFSEAFASNDVHQTLLATYDRYVD